VVGLADGEAIACKLKLFVAPSAKNLNTDCVAVVLACISNAGATIIPLLAADAKPPGEKARETAKIKSANFLKMEHEFFFRIKRK